MSSSPSPSAATSAEAVPTTKPSPIPLADEILARLSDDSSPQFWRNGRVILNTACFDSNPHKAQHMANAACHMARLYSAPLSARAELGKQLAGEDERVALYMWKEAVLVGHATLRKAIEASGQVVMRNGPEHFNDTVAQLMEDKRRAILDVANEDERREAAARFCDEYAQDGDDYESSQLLFDAAVRGDAALTRYLLVERRIAPMPASTPSLAPLHAACANGHPDCAEVLLAHGGLDVNQPDEFGGMPLMRAAVAGHADVVEWLLHRGADPRQREARDGRFTALDYGGGRGARIVRLLLDAGAEPSSTALAAAASYADDEAFGMLLEGMELAPATELLEDEALAPLDKEGAREAKQATAEKQARELIVPIEQAGSGGSVHIVNKLLDLFVVRHPESEPGQTQPAPRPLGPTAEAIAALSKAAVNAVGADHADAARILLDLALSLADGAPEATANLKPSTLLTFAAQNNALSTAAMLLSSYGADVNAPGPPPRAATPLYAAVHAGHAEMVAFLAGRGADLHLGSGKYANGPTPLWLAVYAQDEDMARLLLRLGGPVEGVEVSVSPESKRVWIFAERARRAPVYIVADGPDETRWGDRDKGIMFLCLDYPDGFGQRTESTESPEGRGVVGIPGSIMIRKSDEELSAGGGREVRRE